MDRVIKVYSNVEVRSCPVFLQEELTRLSKIGFNFETILTEDKENIRKIVDAPVSILDKKPDNQPVNEAEEGKKE